MIWMYLIKDYKGAASKIQYGLKGDKVFIIKNEINMVLVLSENGHQFWVNQNELSSTHIEKDLIQPTKTLTNVVKTKKNKR